MKKVFIVFTVLLMVATHAGAANWFESSDWVKGLSRQEQVIVLNIMLFELDKYLNKIIVEDPRDAADRNFLLMRVSSIGRGIAATLATQSPEMRRLLSDGYRKRVEFAFGLMDNSEFILAMAKEKKRCANFCGGPDGSEVEKSDSVYRDRAVETGRLLAVYSRILAVNETGRGAVAAEGEGNHPSFEHFQPSGFLLSGK